MLASLVATLTLLAPAGAQSVAAPVPDSELQITLELPAFRRNAALSERLVREAGEQGVLAFEIDPTGTTLVVVATPDQPQRTSAQWRSALAGDGGAAFVVGDVACREIEERLPGGAARVHFDAFVVAGGSVFDIHAVTPSDPQLPGLVRQDFERIVASLRIVYARRGEPSNLPRDVRDAMHRAFCAWPAAARTLKGELARKPDDAALAFVAGELLVLADGSPSEVLEAHSRALGLYSKLRTPTTEQRFAWMLAEEAIGVSLGGLGRHAEALEHLRKCCEIAGQLRSPARPEIAYEAARAAAQSGDANTAVQLLNDAISAEVRWRGVARGDRQLASLAGDRRFQALVR